MTKTYRVAEINNQFQIQIKGERVKYGFLWWSEKRTEAWYPTSTDGHFYIYPQRQWLKRQEPLKTLDEALSIINIWQKPHVYHYPKQIEDLAN